MPELPEVEVCRRGIEPGLVGQRLLGLVVRNGRLRQPVPAGRILTHADLEPIPLVSAGERIRLTASWDDLSISTEAIARSSGAAGERVRLELPGSRKALVGVVAGPGEARITWGPSKS